eukprot:TRINITY_DN78893_c0_g1_i1.p1 TRINITY_DN78893_c0_g1~~TRINITY_DN78893_c0_g1_i1.p1  ORF type:complete len:591 (+),score=94.70 TRINITY_DN78893_c0_g1_i1:58-1773(+)
MVFRGSASFWSKRLGIAAGGVTGGGCLLASVQYNRDEGFRRAVHFNCNILPIALHYKFLELLSSYGWLGADASTEAFARLHKRYAPRTLEIVLEQKGFYVKTAQFLSQYPDVLPKDYVEAYKILRDDAPSMPFEQVKSIVENDFGLPLQEMFQDFEERPIGAASIGQAHAAKLVDGTEVVVKVQYPEAERQFNIDVDLCIYWSSIIAPYYVDILQQLQKTFAAEFNYHREAQLQREAFENLKKDPKARREAVVPEPYDEHHPQAQKLFGRGLATKHVFVMDRLRGKTVDRWAQEQIKMLAAREGVSADEMIKKLGALSQKEIDQLLPSDFAIKSYCMWLSTCDVCQNSLAFLFNWTWGLLSKKQISYVHTVRPINVHELLAHIFRIQARCIFRDGFVNGDPHAGNILLLDDGRLGLIDWGQVASLNADQQALLAKAVIAVADRDEPLTAKMAYEMGLRTKHGNSWVLMKLGTFWVGSFGDDVVAELGGATAFEVNLARIDPLVSTAQDYFPAVRCLMMTRGVAALMGFPGVDSAKKMKSDAQAFLKRSGVDFKTSPGKKLPRPDLKILGLS